MPASEQLSRLTPYAQRLLDDDAVRDQIDRAFSHLRSGAGRARKKGAKKAVTDRKTRRQLSAAAIATTQIVRALREPPPTTRHRGRRLAVISALAGAAVISYRQRSAGDPKTTDN
jgi:hypothetical protein